MLWGAKPQLKQRRHGEHHNLCCVYDKLRSQNEQSKLVVEEEELPSSGLSGPAKANYIFSVFQFVPKVFCNTSHNWSVTRKNHWNVSMDSVVVYCVEEEGISLKCNLHCRIYRIFLLNIVFYLAEYFVYECHLSRRFFKVLLLKHAVDYCVFI